jgi:hypothetical protein
VEDLTVLCADGISTGVVVVSVQPADVTASTYNLASATVTNMARFRTRVDGTDTAGPALTSDPPERYFLIGDTVKFVVTDSATNKTWRCRIKTNDK